MSAPEAPEPIVSIELPRQPWEFVFMDLMGPLPNGETVIVLVDYYSRYFEVELTRVTTAEKLVEFLRDTFSRFDIPTSLRTDNGPQFVSRTFEDFLTEQGIRWLSTTPLWPRANGEVERQNRTLLKALKIAHGKGKSYHSELRSFLTAYRSTPHASTGETPF